MGYITSAALEETGYVVLDSYNKPLDPKEWLDIEYVDWKSSGDTRFAPLASAFGEIECNGFWNHKPPRTDKDGVWIPAQTELAPTLTERALEPGANVGRCRIIELQPNSYGDCLYNLHQDDNNRLNPDGTGWVVRGFFNLTDDTESYFVLRHNRTDPEGEVRIALPAGAQLIIDTQRLWHAATHLGNEPRYCLITSWESGPELDAYIEKYHGVNHVESVPISQETLDAGQAEQARRDAARAAYYAAKGQAELAAQTAMSEA
ncbi:MULTISPECIES: hypothetical protein [Microbacterium]|uniref:hypothetical protein n=1 Tax=Microbacterium TaxID=33882 RepID=UPI0006F3EB2D|nr:MULTISPECIES: hypothetical protein [unclassified Microbacterium]MBN9197130.1 hypothetical protein [Microbacterium ginsengisoli]KQR91206.1 hypothetical protein ASF93_07575 [Microbacterium sp. Leaf347]KQS01208.1 hypothetical protein ASG00_10405 [Microbacterium sp. Leaf351]ODU77459.1 MAG: hypothetical protein ABT08_06795 [Microbacterium sp. SCN 71-21]OJU77080.1 MAG: hypothetical protein BGO15_06165 [Microbacterium sp. 71-23]